MAGAGFDTGGRCGETWVNPYGAWYHRPWYQSIFTASGIAGTSCHCEARSAEANPRPDEPWYACQAGDCFGASRLAMTGLAGFPITVKTL